VSRTDNGTIRRSLSERRGERSAPERRRAGAIRSRPAACSRQDGQRGRVASHDRGTEFVQRADERRRGPSGERPVAAGQHRVAGSDEASTTELAKCPPVAMIVAVRARFLRRGGRPGCEQRRETTRQQQALVDGHRPEVVQEYGGAPVVPERGEGDVPVQVKIPDPGRVGDERLRRLPRDRRVVATRRNSPSGRTWSPAGVPEVMGAGGRAAVSSL